MKLIIFIALGLGFSLGTHADPHKKHAKPHHGDHKNAWKKMDADGDKKVSKAEFTQAMTQKFTLMDSNGDGFVTKAERKDFRKKKKMMR